MVMTKLKFRCLFKYLFKINVFKDSLVIFQIRIRLRKDWQKQLLPIMLVYYQLSFLGHL
jgi:hypothetical protein